MQGQRSVAEMLLKLSDIEPGENIVDELYNGTCPKNAGTQNTHKRHFSYVLAAAF
jgi:hypothetical protein